jgi:hypothetical protein
MKPRGGFYFLLALPSVYGLLRTVVVALNHPIRNSLCEVAQEFDSPAL